MSEISNETKEPTLLDYWNIIYKYKTFIISVTTIACILTLIISLLMPKIYTATTVVLPPEAEKGGKLSFLGSSFLSSSLPDLMGGDANTNMVLAMLKSKRMAEDVVNKFNLIEIYKVKTIGTAIASLQKNTNILLTKEKAITLNVDSPLPQLSSDIANFYINNLDLMNSDLSITSAKPVVRVLDRAYPPEKKSKPNISSNLTMTFFIAFIISVLIAFIRDYIKGKGK
ncbi:MAG: hypothetical protein A2231_02345 [Candidatus Firestonebacteria bacterium RIFOXYA2_FULL_40_8]|nr:MAG: hypothetical protein A2231_02345 [Candidatus Firestonebacteria bacterium RIFOXYA2_FULL_40_8]